MDDLFESKSPASAITEDTQHLPLAARMRPRRLQELVGQEHLTEEGKLLNRLIKSDQIRSLILYGPPGTGKTTIARIISRETRSVFVSINAVTSNVAELRKILQQAENQLKQKKMRTILFIDEIHRFSKSQQDVLMPFAENGVVILIGATTQNPSFALNAPLLSRSTILELKALDENALKQIIQTALSDTEKGLGSHKISLKNEVLDFMARQAAGDARRALNILETAFLTTVPGAKGGRDISIQDAEEAAQKLMIHYDHDEDFHYDTISAFIKSMRGSDPDAAIYWLAKMLYAGEDPRFIIRRMLIFASEDIGNADPQALILAASALQAIEFVGMPESQIILGHAVAYLSLAPKSNASYLAITHALADIENGKVLQVPDHLRDSHGLAAKKLGHGTGYKYPHSDVSAQSSELPQPKDQSYLTEKLRYYIPKDSGFEKTLKDRLPQTES